VGYVELPLGGDDRHLNSLGAGWHLADFYWHAGLLLLVGFCGACHVNTGVCQRSAACLPSGLRIRNVHLYHGIRVNKHKEKSIKPSHKRQAKAR
jgi:hypothetical protein